MSSNVGPDEASVDRLVGRKPTPRVLVLTEDEELIEKVAELVPTYDVVDSVADRRQEEYDFVIATRSIRYRSFTGVQAPAGHLFLLTFGVEEMGAVVVDRDGPDDWSETGIRYTHYSQATELIVPGNVHSPLVPMVESDLLPAARRRDGEHLVIGTSAVPVPIDKTASRPLLKTADGGYIAALWARPGGGFALGLPADVTDRVGWIKAALKVFRAIEPERFEQIPGWEELDEWSTAEERDLRGTLAELEAEREQVTRELDEQIDEVRAHLAATSAKAEAGWRRLLTAQGDELVDVVSAALEHLGFEVKPMDPEADPNNRLEDLRLTDRDDDQWEALVEVRGYKGGAQLSDLARVTRFVRRYRDETDRWPPAVWYVVNQLAGRDPEARQPVLSSQPAELEEWADANGGLAVDTTDLFRLVVAVDEGKVSASEARQQLRDARVRFQHTDP